MSFMWKKCSRRDDRWDSFSSDCCHRENWNYDDRCDFLCRCHNRCPSCINASIGPSTTTLTAPLLSQTLKLTAATLPIDTFILKERNLQARFTGYLNISSPAVAAATAATFNFTLYKVCHGSYNSEAISRFTATEILTAPNVPVIQNLDFAAGICVSRCDRCCTYLLELTSILSSAPVTLDFTISGVFCVQPFRCC